MPQRCKPRPDPYHACTLALDGYAPDRAWLQDFEKLCQRLDQAVTQDVSELGGWTAMVARLAPQTRARLTRDLRHHHAFVGQIADWLEVLEHRQDPAQMGSL